MPPPFRETEIRPLCGICKAEAVSRCARCGRPLCARHAHDDEHRCPSCESDFAHRRTGVQMADFGWSVLGASLLGAFAVALLFGGSLVDPFVIFALIAGPVGLGSALHGRRAFMPQASRRRFLAERKVKALPGE